MAQDIAQQPAAGGLGAARPQSLEPSAGGFAAAFRRAGAAGFAWLRSGEAPTAAWRSRPNPGRRAPAVSVIIPCHNGAATLPAALQSLARQRFAAWEAVIVDDGSGDETAAVAARHLRADPRLRLVRQDRQGVAAARNAGIRMARGDWLLFLDCDDWLAPRALSELLTCARRNPAAGVVVGRAVKTLASGARAPLPSFDLSEPFSALCCEGRLAIHSAIVRRSLVERIGGFDACLRTNEDWDLWQRLARMGVAFAQSPKVLAFYRNSPDSLSKSSRQVAADGLTVMRRGHAPDPRVGRPAPAHARGAPADALPARELYYLLWCAAREIAAGGEGTEIARLAGSPEAVDPEPRNLGRLMASGMADAAGVSELALGGRWSEFEPKLAAALSILGADRVRLRELTLAVVKARLEGGAPGDGDRLDLEFGLAPGRSGVRQLVWRGRTLGMLAVPQLAPRNAVALRRIALRQVVRLPLRDVLVRSGCLGSLALWAAVLPRAVSLVARQRRLDAGFLKATARRAMQEALQVSLARCAAPAGPPPDEHDVAVRELEAEAVRCASRLPPAALRPAPVPRRLRPGVAASVPVLMYHRVARDPAPGLERYCVSPAAFENQLKLLRSAGYCTATPDELELFLRLEAGLPPRTVILTFDDGYVDFAGEAWPLLKRHGLTAVVFAVPDRVGGSADWDGDQGPPAALMDWRTLRELACDGAVIESHSDTHRPLTRLPVEALYREALRSRAAIAQAIGRAPRSFCYPFGAYDPTAEQVLDECGYRLAFTTEPGVCALSAAPLRIPRLEVAGGEGLETFARRLRI
jgi:peptidoglycan/xylan/chitin deacetylase (PgdA/CDA1 family)